jgi:hypothetical protein
MTREPAQRDRVDVEEVTGQRAGCRCAKELRPGRSKSSRGRFAAMSSKHIRHARRRDGDTELDVLLVWAWTDPNESEQLSNEQEGD